MKTPIAENLESTLDDNQTQAILEIFDRIGISQWLKQNPFKAIKLSQTTFLDGKETNGVYNYQTREAQISTSRQPSEYGTSLDWGKIHTLSATGSNVLEAVQFTALHELGHHVHKALLENNKLQFWMTMNALKTNGVSQYAKSAEVEYFAETFAAWILCRTELAVYDELGYGMMNRALKALAIEVKEYDFGY